MMRNKEELMIYEDKEKFYYVYLLDMFFFITISNIH